MPRHKPKGCRVRLRPAGWRLDPYLPVQFKCATGISRIPLIHAFIERSERLADSIRDSFSKHQGGAVMMGVHVVLDKIEFRNEPPARYPPVARLNTLRLYPRRVACEELYPFMGRVSVGIQHDVRLPHLPQIDTNLCLGIFRGIGPLLLGHIDTERAKIPRVQHEVRRQFMQVIHERRSVGIRDRLDYEIDPIQELPALRLRRQRFHLFKNVGRAGNLIRMLPACNEETGLCGDCFCLREIPAFKRRRDIDCPNSVTQPGSSRRKWADAWKARQFTDDLFALFGADWLVPLNDTLRWGSAPDIGHLG